MMVFQRTLMSKPIKRLLCFFESKDYESLVKKTFDKIFDSMTALEKDFKNYPEFDISLNNEVLTVNIGEQYGTYVLNKQSICRQIWLSSPISGPKRFDHVGKLWIYRRTNESLSEILSSEMSKILEKKIQINC